MARAGLAGECGNAPVGVRVKGQARALRGRLDPGSVPNLDGAGAGGVPRGHRAPVGEAEVGQGRLAASRRSGHALLAVEPFWIHVRWDLVQHD